MARTASCPSCGAPVVFQSAASVFAVCEYCQSTLVRHDQALEDIGKMAALVEDRSPLQIGSEGSYQGIHFALIGRIQIKYSQGSWNEWHLLFDDMRTGWLSEAAGEYVLTFAHQPQEALPEFDSLKVGQRFLVNGQPWTVSNIEAAECIAGQGELPFTVGGGYALPTVDLRNGRNFATLDYSDSPPRLYIGEAVPFASLKLANLREGMAGAEPATVQAKVFRCPSCGSPMQARSAEILAVGCSSCGAVVDTRDETCRLLSKALSLRDESTPPRLPLGTKGKLDGKPVEVIGYLVKQCQADGMDWEWGEYLLAGENGTYRWLTEYDGHWNVVDVLSDPPRRSGAVDTVDIDWDGKTFKHFTTTNVAEVIQVSGEFTWLVRRGEKNKIVDFVAPPLMLSRETTGKELSWSKGVYVAPEAIREAFGLKSTLREPFGVYANQPNPWEETHKRVCGLFWKFLLLAIVLQAFFMFISGSRVLLREDFVFAPHKADDSVVTREFVVAGRPRKLAVRNSTSLDNNWIGLQLMLVNKATGAAWPASREISFYRGYDDGPWSEGSNQDEVVFVDIPPGTYYLEIEPDMAQDKLGDIHDRLEVETGGVGWSNFVMALIFLALFPVFSRMRHSAFEVRRWMESDHPKVTAEDNDDSDD